MVVVAQLWLGRPVKSLEHSCGAVAWTVMVTVEAALLAPKLSVTTRLKIRVALPAGAVNAGVMLWGSDRVTVGPAVWAQA